MEESEYERQRAENIAKNKALLKQLQLDSLSASLTSSSSAKSSPKPKATPRKSTPRVKKERTESPVPRRQSSRLAGIPVDSEAEKRKLEDESMALQAAESAKRQRVAGDLSFEIKRGLLGKDAWEEKTLTKEEVEGMEEGDLKQTRKRLMGLKIWEEFEPSELKITPERIYHLSFHPTTTKPLIFAADKVGNFGILSCSSTGSEAPDITQFKPHTRTISSFFIPTAAPETLYTASYDSSIRRLDLNSGKSVEVYVNPDESALSAINALDDACHTLLFSTLEGEVGRYDTREPDSKAEMWQCSDKKIGGCHVFPNDPNYFATASLDRTVKIWDLRHMEAPLATHGNRLSVSAAQWSSTGKLATTSYDDTVKIYNPDLEGLAGIKAKVKAEATEPGENGFPTDFEGVEMEPEHTIPHNNQTGRWVTILRAVWQEQPEDNVQKLVVANMNRGIDVYGEDGVQLAHLSDGELVSAVPAVARAHPSRTWFAGGTASGKVVLYM